jgi:hypothetical protein
LVDEPAMAGNDDGDDLCRERVGGLPKYYHRQTA